MAASTARTTFHKLKHAISILLTILSAPFPRFLRPTSNKDSGDLHPTAYLDALRGYAAWVVYNSHTVSPWKAPNWPLMQIAAFKVLCQGHGMIDVFFIISGFALSYSMLGYMHSNQPNKVLDSLASSVVRRHVRLYLPTIFATFIAMVCFATGIAHKSEDPDILQPTFLGNVWHWMRDVSGMIDPFPHVSTGWHTGIIGSNYLPQMWTIPIEFRGSMILFLFCAAVCKMNAWKRGIVTLATSAACFWYQTAYAGLFLFGMWLADRRLGRAQREQAESKYRPDRAPDASTAATSEELEDGMEESKPFITASPDAAPERSSWLGWAYLRRRPSPLPFTVPKLLWEIAYIILAYFGIIFLAFHAYEEDITTASAFPYNLGAWIMPPTYWDSVDARIEWPLSLGAILLCYALDHSRLLRAPLLTPFSQFIGELSFGIYAMHNTIRWIVWERYFVPWQQQYFGTEAMEFWVIFPGYLVMTFLVIWAGEGFRRVDVRCVDLARRMKDHLFAD